MLAGILAAGVVAYVVVQILRPAPNPVVKGTLPELSKVPGSAPSLPWPATGQSVVGAVGIGTFASSGTLTPAPIASLAKMMTAIVTLQDHPLGPGDSGPTVTIDSAAVAGYQAARAQGESTVPVSVGEQLSELQMLEALLVGSDDNMADVIARWDAGSVPAFVDKMNAEAHRLGLHDTHYADVSGLSPFTTSTATEQFVVAEAAISNPVIAAISKLPSVQLPVAGTVVNFNNLVGTDGFVGLKTGNTSAAGGCFAFAAVTTVSGQPATALGVVMGVRGPNMLNAALQAGKSLADATRAGLTTVTVVQAGSAGAKVSAPWTSSVPADAAHTLRFVAWPGLGIMIKFSGLRLTGGVPAGTRVGDARVTVGQASDRVVFKTRYTFPSAPVTWKLHNF